MARLDAKDSEILSVLERDGRITNLALAAKVGLSPSACLRRVQDMEKAGVITGYRAVTDRAALGVGFIAYIAVGLSDHSQAAQRAFERAVARARKGYVEQCAASKVAPDAGFLSDLRFHDLRHEATSRLASIFPMHELTKITGHKDPRMLMRYYHPRAEELARKLK